MKQELTSINKLATALKRSHTATARWLKNPAWPFARTAPWSRAEIPRMLKWIVDYTEAKGIEGATGASDPETKKLRNDRMGLQIRRLQAQAEAAEMALQREAGKLMDAQAVEDEWARVGALIRNGFENLPSQLVPLALSHGMPQEASPHFSQQITEIVTAILARLAGSATAQSTESHQ